MPSGNTTKQQQELSIIFDSVPAWIFYKDKENRFIRVNKAFSAAMNQPKDNLEGKSLFDIYPKDQAEAFWQDDKQIIESGKSKTNIIESANTAKGLRWVQTDKIPYLDEKGDIIGVIGFSIDITDRKRAEEKIAGSQLMLQKIIDLIPIRIFWKDMKLNYLGCNKAFAQDAGKTRTEDVVGKDDFQMGWKDQADLYRKDDMAVITSKKSKIDYEEEQTTPTGSKIWLNTNKVPLSDDNGKIIGVLGTYIDITDRKLTDNKLRESLENTNERTADVEKINKLMLGRELKMIELKAKVEELTKKLERTNSTAK
jgi:PAS domain S-box-containing protein